METMVASIKAASMFSSQKVIDKIYPAEATTIRFQENIVSAPFFI